MQNRNFAMPSSSTISQRVAALKDFVATYESQKDAAEALKISESRLSRALDPHKATDRKLAPIERAVAEMQSGDGAPAGVRETKIRYMTRRERLVTEADIRPPPILVPRLVASAGPSGFELQEYASVQIDPDELRRRYQVDPSRVGEMVVSGPSMYPTLAPGSIVRIYLMNGEPIRDGVIYVLQEKAVPHGVLVKRVKFSRGRVTVASDNESYPTDEMDGETFEASYRVLARLLDKTEAL